MPRDRNTEGINMAKRRCMFHGSHSAAGDLTKLSRYPKARRIKGAEDPPLFGTAPYSVIRRLAPGMRFVLAGWCFSSRHGILGKELVHASLGVFPLDPVALLHLAHHLLGPTVDEGQIIVSELAELLLNGAL